MPSLALRGGARVAVVPDEWRDAFAVVTRGRVQLELRDGAPGPILKRHAGFWLRDTGVRALRNPGRHTATVRVFRLPTGTRLGEKPMTDVIPEVRTGRFRRLAGTGLTATLVAVVATTAGAALATAVGVDFAVSGGETIPVPGFAVVTAGFSLVGVVIAAAFLRWSAHPAARFRGTAVALTALSLVPPVLAGADAATTTALIALHLVPAAVMIPALTHSLRTRSDSQR